MTNLPPPGEGTPTPIPRSIPPRFDRRPGRRPVIDTQNERLDDGVNRCPKCGSTEIQLRPSAGMLICLFCRHEWSEARLDETIANGDLATLTGTTLGSGATDIDTAADSLITMKCEGCGAEVVVNTEAQMGSRCHWCRHVLTINEQVPNGAVPDAVLPFTITHDDAVARIDAFAGKRRMFAHRAFLREFEPDNIVGVYMPYMVVDSNASADIAGVGEIQTRKYTRGSGNDKETFYDADVYDVQRHVDFTVDDLTIESSAERANIDASIQHQQHHQHDPAVRHRERGEVERQLPHRVHVGEARPGRRPLVPVVENQLLSIARSQVESSVDRYDRGVRWERERLEVHGTRWVAMYLPVWLYSYYHEEGGKGMVHYIAVNGRTGEVMGSVPVSHPRLLAAAAAVGGIIEILAIAILVAAG
jgi:ribosomal protein S27E